MTFGDLHYSDWNQTKCISKTFAVKVSLIRTHPLAICYISVSKFSNFTELL